MKYKALITFALLGFLVASVESQEIYTPLATMEGRSFTAQDLQPNISEVWLKLPETLAKARKDAVEIQIDEILLNQEAGKRKIPVEALLKAEVEKKVADPDERTIKAVYDENRASLGDTPLEKVRSQIISYLRTDSEKKARKDFIERLRESAKIDYIKDINAERFVTRDVIATVNGEAVTFDDFTRKNGLALYEYEANTFDQVETSLRLIVDAAVYQAEAQARGISVNQLIAAEITGKMKDFSFEEQQRLEDALKTPLYQKYRVKFFLNEPEPFVQHISADDDPFSGNASAPVTIVMFADYECPACAGVHPLIKNLAAKYGDRVRIVFRDFPLTEIHENAFNAALAANAARKQGKFFEYTELLYENQDFLDLESLKKYAADLKLNPEKFAADMNSVESSAEVQKDMSDAQSYGVNGTPTIFVNGYKVRTLSVNAFQNAIEKALAGKFNVIR